MHERVVWPEVDALRVAMFVYVVTNNSKFFANIIEVFGQCQLCKLIIESGFFPLLLINILGVIDKKHTVDTVF